MLPNMTALTDRTLMNRAPCSPANSILEGDLELAMQQQTLQKLIIAETPEGFYIIAILKWAKNKEWYLTTRRDRDRPRIFKDLNRLNEHLKEAYPTDSVEIVRNQEIPEKDKAFAPLAIKSPPEKEVH